MFPSEKRHSCNFSLSPEQICGLLSSSEVFFNPANEHERAGPLHPSPAFKTLEAYRANVSGVESQSLKWRNSILDPIFGATCKGDPKGQERFGELDKELIGGRSVA
jgi:hypothetical protein